jgi:hypothetical protein
MKSPGGPDPSQQMQTRNDAKPCPALKESRYQTQSLQWVRACPPPPPHYPHHAHALCLQLVEGVGGGREALFGSAQGQHGVVPLPQQGLQAALGKVSLRRERGRGEEGGERGGRREEGGGRGAEEDEEEGDGGEGGRGEGYMRLLAACTRGMSRRVARKAIAESPQGVCMRRCEAKRV